MERNKMKNNKHSEIIKLDNVYVNPSLEEIAECVLLNGEGQIGMNGAMMIDTGEFTGRSPNDKYFVEENYSKDNLWWGPVNKKIDSAIYNK